MCSYHNPIITARFSNFKIHILFYFFYDIFTADKKIFIFLLKHTTIGTIYETRFIGLLIHFFSCDWLKKKGNNNNNGII